MEKNQTTAGTNEAQGRQEKSKMNPGSAGTDPNKVKQEIQQDVSHGIGAMTSREAGSRRD